MVLLAYTIFTTTLVLQRKQAARGLALGLASLTIPLVPLLALSRLIVEAIFIAALGLLLFRGLLRPEVRTLPERAVTGRPDRSSGTIPARDGTLTPTRDVARAIPARPTRPPNLIRPVKPHTRLSREQGEPPAPANRQSTNEPTDRRPTCRPAEPLGRGRRPIVDRGRRRASRRPAARPRSPAPRAPPAPATPRPTGTGSRPSSTAARHGRRERQRTSYKPSFMERYRTAIIAIAAFARRRPPRLSSSSSRPRSRPSPVRRSGRPTRRRHPAPAPPRTSATCSPTRATATSLAATR